MKKIFLTIGTITALLFGTGCGQNQAPASQFSNSSTPTTSTSENFDYKEYVSTPDTLSWKAGAEIQDRISTELKAGKMIQEISEPRKLTTPPEIYPAQLVKYFQLGNMQFALGQVLSGLTFGRWTDETTLVSGIWYADKNDTIWKPLISLTHASGHEPQNNIFDFWNEGRKLRLLLVDSQGGGSGEGIAKVLGSIESGKQWKTMQCFYFVDERFNNMQKKMKTTYHGTIDGWIKEEKTKDTFVEYKYNSSTNRFDGFQFGTLPVGGESCSNVVFPE